MTFTKKQVGITSTVLTIFIGFALSPAFGAVFALLAFSFLTM